MEERSGAEWGSPVVGVEIYNRRLSKQSEEGVYIGIGYMVSNTVRGTIYSNV